MLQRSLVQEVIEEFGHLCIILPKFHCELNFIEYFWGAFKRYLRDHCDYTFPTLQANSIGSRQQIAHSEMAQPNDAVDGCLQRWFECEGCTFSRAGFSKKYTHRRVLERVAAAFD